MTAGNPLRQPPGDKLRFLAETVLAEASLLRITDGRLFAAPMDALRAASLRHDIDLAERVDAFVARFGRLQDTLPASTSIHEHPSIHRWAPLGRVSLRDTIPHDLDVPAQGPESLLRDRKQGWHPS